MKLFFPIALFLALLSFSATAAAEENSVFQWSGEELYYSVRISGAEAMRAGLRMGEVQERDGRTFVPLNGMARSRGIFDAIYPLDDRAHTFIHPATFFPIRSEKIFDEAGKRRSYFVDYRHHRFEAEVDREREDRQTRFTASIPGDTHDMLSWLYHFRSQRISPGDTYSYYIYDGWLLSRLDLEVVGRDEILTPMGWFLTWKVHFSREIMEVNRTFRSGRDGGPATPPEVSIREQARHTGHLWFSRDDNLLPVQLTIPTMLGYGEAVLVRYQPATSR